MNDETNSADSPLTTQNALVCGVLSSARLADSRSGNPFRRERPAFL